VVKLRGNAGNGVPLPFSRGGRRSRSSGGPDGWTCRKWKTDNVTSKGSAIDMSECWTQSQLIEKTNTYPWLIVRNRKLGCKTMSEREEHQNPTDCRNSFVVGLDKCFSRSHRSFEVKSAGVLKMFNHQNSGGHKTAERILATTENKVMEQMSARLQKSHEHSTQRIFRTAYYLAKRRRPFADIPELVDLQTLNGAEMGDCFR